MLISNLLICFTVLAHEKKNPQRLSVVHLILFKCLGVRRPIPTKYLKGSIYYNSKLFRYIRYRFFDVKLFILENVIPQMSLSLTYQTCAFFFSSTKYTQQKINTCWGFMCQWTRLPYAQKRWFICLLLRVTWLVFFKGFERVKHCKFAIVI